MVCSHLSFLITDRNHLAKAEMMFVYSTQWTGYLAME